MLTWSHIFRSLSIVYWIKYKCLNPYHLISLFLYYILPQLHFNYISFLQHNTDCASIHPFLPSVMFPGTQINSKTFCWKFQNFTFNFVWFSYTEITGNSEVFVSLSVPLLQYTLACIIIPLIGLYSLLVYKYICKWKI